MCAIDWAALGTWAAVVLALSFFVLDRIDRRKRDRAEAKIIALLLGTELSIISTMARALAAEVATENSAGMLDALLALDEHNRGRIADWAANLPTETLESVVGRVHVLPARAATALMALLSSVRELRLIADTLRNMSNSEAIENIDAFMPHFRREAALAGVRARDAVAACDAVATA